MRVALIGGVVTALLAMPEAAAAQFGIGGRLSWVRRDVKVEEDSTRFTGGQIRARLSPRTAFELSLDIHSETNRAETARFGRYPIQASLLLYPVRSVFSPCFLGGAGWYTEIRGPGWRRNRLVRNRSRFRLARRPRRGAETRSPCRPARRLSLYLPQLRRR